MNEVELDYSRRRNTLESKWRGMEAEARSGAIEVEPSKSPGELDLTYLTGPHKGSKCLGMSSWGSVDQSKLMIDIQEPGSDANRPTQFSMNSNIMTGLMILEPRSSIL